MSWKGIDEFYVKALEAYSKLQDIKEGYTNYFQQVSEVRVNNHGLLLCGKKSVFFSELKDKECDQIKHFLDDKGKWLSFTDFKSKHGITRLNFLNFIQIVSAIKHKYGHIIKEGPTIGGREQRPTPKIDTYPEMKEYFLDKLKERMRTTEKWSELIERYDWDFWPNQFKSARKIAHESKLIAFQYKIFHRAIPTRSYLHRYKVASSPYCLYCATPTEDTVEHYLLFCPRTKLLWEDVSKIFEDKEGISITLTVENCILIPENQDIAWQRWAELCLWLKYFIFLQKLSEKEPNIQAFVAYMESKIKVYRYVATYDQKMSKWHRKWEPWEN